MISPKLNVGKIAGSFIIACIVFPAESPLASEVTAERLTWSGIKLVSGETTVFIDAVGTDIWNGRPPKKLVPVEANTPRRYALITHIHNDHFDVATLKRVLGDSGYVICHREIATYVASRGLRVIPADTFVPVSRGGFGFTAVPAEDGLGDHQISWVIAKDGRKFFHGGDTMWHGQLGVIGLQYGPFDVAFLPINGAIIPSGTNVESSLVQTPLQAVDAAELLRAEVLVPVHYGFQDPPHYVEVPDPIGELAGIADRRNQEIKILEPGEKLVWSE